MPPITSENTAEAIAKVLATEMLDALRPNWTMAAAVNRSYNSDLAQMGDTVNIPIPSPRQAQNLAEGSTVGFTAGGLGNAQVVLNQHAVDGFQIPDITRVLSHPDTARAYLEPAAIGVAEHIETSLTQLYLQLTANDAVGTPGTALTEPVIQSAETTLFNNRVPGLQAKFLIVSGKGYEELRQIPRFSEERIAPGLGLPAIQEALVGGNIGRLLSFFVLRSQIIQQPVASQFKNLAFAQDALALVTRTMPPIEGGRGAVSATAEEGGFGLRVVASYNHSILSNQWTVDVLYGVNSLRPEFGVVVDN